MYLAFPENVFREEEKLPILYQEKASLVERGKAIYSEPIH